MTLSASIAVATVVWEIVVVTPPLVVNLLQAVLCRENKRDELFVVV